MKSIVWAAGAIVTAAIVACGASANTPDDGAKDDGGIPIYDGGGDYQADAGEGGGSACGDLTTVDNCGVCGNACPGQDAAASNASCGGEAGAPTCEFTCQGEHYDIDQDASDGCEKVDAPIQNHVVATATDLGSVDCNDGDSAQNLSGIMPSDSREHVNPTISGFDSATGSAPDYWTIIGTGSGVCENDLNLTLTVTGSSKPTYYMLNATASSAGHGPYSCAITSGTSCSISNGSGSYGSGDTIVWWVSHTCSVVTPEAPSYTITGHL